MDLLELDRLPRAGAGDDRLGARPVGADDGAVLARVGAEQGVRVVVLAVDEAFDVALQLRVDGGLHATSTSSSRVIPATGISTQSGRLLSS